MKRPQTSRKTIFLAVSAALLVCSVAANAGTLPTIAANQMPGGGQVLAVSGGTSVNGGGVGKAITGLNPGASISIQNAKYNAPYTVIRWGGSSAPADSTNPGGFNVGSSAAITFTTSNQYTGGGVLNIDASGNPSQIEGTVAGNNMAVYLANGNGLVVGATGKLNLPQGGGLLAWSMNNTTAVQDFVGNNNQNTSYLDLGALGTPGDITIAKGGQGTIGNEPLIVAGGNIVNSGTFTIGNTTTSQAGGGSAVFLAGWTPIKASRSVDGISGTPTYRLATLYNGEASLSFNRFQGGSSTGVSGTFTNNGTISLQQVNNYDLFPLAILSQSGLADYGTIKSTNAPIAIYNNANSVTVDGTINAPGGNYLLPGAQYSMQNQTNGYYYNGYSSNTLMIANPNGNVVFGSQASVGGGNVAIAGENISGANGTFPLSANNLTLYSAGNINAPGSTSFLNNGLGINPYIAGGTININLYSAAAATNPATANYINLNVNGNLVIDSAGTGSPAAAGIENGYYNNSTNTYQYPASPNSNGNYGAIASNSTITDSDTTSVGGSLLIQASGTLTIAPQPTGGYALPFDTLYTAQYNNSFGSYTYTNFNLNPFVFSGGVVFSGNQGVTVNVPIINAWGSNPNPIPYQGVFLEGSAIAVNNNAWFMTQPYNFVNVSVKPTTGIPADYWLSGGLINSPSVYTPNDSGVYQNSYTSEIAAYLANPATWHNSVNTTPYP
jgi:hypothetical protein